MILNFLKHIWKRLKSEIGFSDSAHHKLMSEDFTYYPPVTISNSLFMSLGLSLTGSLVVSFLSSYYFIINLL